MPELKIILKNFLDDEGRLIKFPAKRKMKLYALFFLAQAFEADREYTEKEVNALLNERHTFADPATLRRELFDYRFLDRSRDGKSYCLSEPQPDFERLGL